MNNLYLTLCDKAGEMCNGDLERESNVMFQYYAELIIRECIEAIEDPWSKSAGVAQSAIKQHFGLET